MAVKKHEIMHDSNQLDLEALEKYLRQLNEQPHYLPPPAELVKACNDIVRCLSRAPGTAVQLWGVLQTVEEFLQRIVSEVDRTTRNDILTAVLFKLYSYISDPQSDACPATAVSLSVLNDAGTETKLSAARWLVQQGAAGPAGAGLRASLSCLYSWLIEWNSTPVLGDFVSAFLTGLEENGVNDVLIEVSLDNLERLFSTLDSAPAQPTAHVIFHVMASLRGSSEALERIAPHVERVLTCLAAESGQWSRQLLQNVVDIVTDMLEQTRETLRGEALEAFRARYIDLMSCLERHIASRTCTFLQLPMWRSPTDMTLPIAGPPSIIIERKVGLINLGNTCYMNSVIQALLVTKQFSSHVVMKMHNAPYWSKMGGLFAKLMHSISTKLNPEDTFKLLKPPFFAPQLQQDSSEFLGYLLELLTTYEHVSERNFDYSRTPVLVGHRNRTLSLLHQNSNSEGEYSAAGSSNRRSMSPRPSSSAAGPSSSLKRGSCSDVDQLVPKKRTRTTDSAHRESFVDNMFGGVLLTRVECSTCHSSSLSRDVFRDLQLSFPDKPKGWPYSVQGLLEYYCSKEELTGDNKYQCRDCGVLRDAERSVLIETTPKYLILVLKNFKFEAKELVQTKLMHSIRHNHHIALPTVRSQADHSTYMLYAAVVHAGTTLDSGHYYTVTYENEQWIVYNDHIVGPADPSELNDVGKACTPYILFYRRSDIEESANPGLDELPPKVRSMVLAHNKHYVEKVRNIRCQ